MDNMNITSVQYFVSSVTGENTAVNCTIDGTEMSVPLDPANRHFAEIMRQVEAGELVIQEAE
jgi:hypothetical protein